MNSEDPVRNSVKALGDWRAKLDRAYGPGADATVVMDVAADQGRLAEIVTFCREAAEGASLAEILTFVLVAPLGAMGGVAGGRTGPAGTDRGDRRCSAW